MTAGTEPSPPPEAPEGTAELHAAAAVALRAITGAASLSEIEQARATHLGRGDGLLSGFLRRVKDQPAARRKPFAELTQRLVRDAEEALAARREALRAEEAERRLSAEALDLTAPAPPLPRGRLHPVTLVTREIRRIFEALGYIAIDGPEVEYDRYNFELVNMPPGHPSRDVQETFWIDDARLLRTHTTPVQIRSMIERGAPLRIIVPGKTFRRDYDATHFPMFHQVEGLCVDEGIALSDLKGTLEYFARSMFGPDRAIRLRPHHFAYTEPSLEVDVSCMVCEGKGCATCRQSGWIEILGSGMVHPNVLRNGGVDAERYSGFAFGMGIERIAQLAYGIEDGRLLFQNDVRFIRQ